MAQLGGKSVRSLITSLELLSDDGGTVLTIERGDPTSGPRIKLRRPWESTWDSGLTTFSVSSRDADMLSKAIAGQDASYARSQVDEISTSRFSGDAPPDAEELNKAQLEYEARCTELDIERARAANIQQEFILDHSRDRHVTGDVPGCPSCEAKVIPSIPVERSSDEEEGDDVPF